MPPPPNMAFDTSDDLLEFVTRFRTLQLHRDTNDELIKDLIIYCERVESALRNENNKLKQDLKDVQFDLEDAVKTRREYQHRLASRELELRSLSNSNDYMKNRNPYVVILIDGDGSLFKSAYINQGIEGGKKAAYALRSAIAHQCGEHADDVEIVCSVYANLAGLSKAMKRDGSLELDSDMKDFTLGFTQAKASFDFVDVGHGKERADSKIKEGTRWHLKNVNCRQVILGVSHDAGYAPFLDEILRDDDTRSRVTIAEGFPTVREIVNTGVNILNLTEHIFRSDKLVDRTNHRLPTPPASFASPSAASAASISTTGTSITVSTVANTSAPSSYAGVAGNASPPPTIILPFATKPKTTPVIRAAAPKPAPWSPGPRGIDSPIAVNQSVLDNIKKRRDGDKLCNNHYLRGPCQKGEACVFEHNYKPTADEKVAISFLARLNPCTNGQDCDTEDCIYGHHCPSVRDGQCTHPYCKFRPDEHPPNTKYRNTYTMNDY